MPIRFSAFGRVFAPTWPITLLTLVLMTAFVGLGRWQWHRGEAKQAVWAEYARNADAETLSTRAFDAVDRFAHLSVTGHFEPWHQFILDNISHAGLPGYEVLTPFVLIDGRRTIVNRGWVPFTGYRDRLPDVSLRDPGEVTIKARLDDLPSGGLASGRAAPVAGPSWPKLTSFPTQADLETALGQKLQHRILLLDPQASYGYVRVWAPPGMPPERHFSYAIQWWGFAVVLLVLYFGLNFRKVS
jgi:surfeit locus 1 family protein